MTQENGYGSETSYHTTMSRPKDPEYGEHLMMQRILWEAHVTKGPPQRKPLLKTTCKMNGKVCKVIVDSGSTNNITSIEMVDKLKFQRIPHPHPYRASWLTRDRQTSVNEQVWM